MHKLVVVFIFFFSTSVFAQGEANFWFFGENSGLNFNKGIGEPSPISGSLNTFEGCSSFSTKEGELLFYSDGTSVWNKSHELMPNGTDLKGHPSSTQSAMIIPRPAHTNEYYLFTVGSRVDDGEFGFNYYTIDMSQEGGLGDVVSGPIDLSDGKSDEWTEKVAAIKGKECNTYWVISCVGNEFYTYKVTSSGVSETPVVSTVSFTAIDRRGYLKISPDGKKIAIAHMRSVEGNRRSNGRLFMYDFNDETGVVTNQRNLPLVAPGINPYGVEFSSNSEKLYIHGSNDYYSDVPSEYNNPNNHWSTLYQFDLGFNNIADVIASRRIIDSRNLYRGALQLGPDRKIYRTLAASYNEGSPFLGVIENPENDGLASNYKHNKISLNGNNATQGLPPFIASIFYQIEITGTDTSGKVNVLNDQTIDLCIGDDLLVSPKILTGNVVYNWFYNGAPFSNASNISFTNVSLSDNGLYSLIVTKTDVCGITSTSEGEFTLKIHEIPVANKPLDIEVCDGDLDGFYVFDLHSLKDSEILDGQNPFEFDVRYYKSRADALAKNNEIVDFYTNITRFGKDEIFARIQNVGNTNCYELTNFTLHVFETPNPPLKIEVLGKCDTNNIGTDTDGISVFNLREKETEILNGQAASLFTISYFTDSKTTELIATPSSFQNTSRSQTIYCKIENNLNSSCIAYTSFEIEVFELPVIVDTVSLKQCDDDNDGFSFFNLSEANEKISSNASNEVFTYYESSLGALNKYVSEEITTTTVYKNKTRNTDIIWVRIENENGCHRISKLNLIVSTTKIPSTFQREFYICDDYVDTINDEKDGVSTFNFSNVTDELRASFDKGQKLTIKYYRNEDDALAEKDAILDPSKYRNIGYLNEQTIYIRVDSQLDNDCLGLGPHIKLYVEKIPIANPVRIERQCDDDFDGIFPFDVSSLENTVLNGQTGMKVSYFDEKGNTLPSPLPNPFYSTSQTIRIRVTDSNSKDNNGACYAEVTTEFVVDKKPIANSVAPFEVCDDDFDGQFSFDTSTLEDSVLNGQTSMLVSYFDENGDALPSPLPNPFQTATQRITVVVKNKENETCVANRTIDFIVNSKPDFELNETEIYCLNLAPIVVETYNALGNYTYHWVDESDTIVSTNYNAIISKAGKYTVVATSTAGCESLAKTIEIIASSVATFTMDDIVIVDDSENNSITVNTENLGIGIYEFAIKKDGSVISSYQDEPVFEDLNSGFYTVYIQDKNNCGFEKLDIAIVGFPKFFSPNQDGINDTWKLVGVNEKFYGTSKINIYDRYGKLVAQIDPKGEGWNGMYNGKELPATDYWFSAALVDADGKIRIRKGNFSLLR